MENRLPINQTGTPLERHTPDLTITLQIGAFGVKNYLFQPGFMAWKTATSPAPFRGAAPKGVTRMKNIGGLLHILRCKLAADQPAGFPVLFAVGDFVQYREHALNVTTAVVLAKMKQTVRGHGGAIDKMDAGPLHYLNKLASEGVHMMVQPRLAVD